MKKVVVMSEYPIHLAAYPLRLANSTIASVLLTDEYLFATYFATLLQVCKLDSDADSIINFSDVMKKHLGDYFDLASITKMDLKDSEDRDRMMKVIDNLRVQFNEKISSSYVTDFFIGITVFNAIKDAARNRSGTKTAPEIFGDLLTDLIQPKIDEMIGISSITENIARLARLIGLNESEKRLIELNYMLSTDIRMMIFRDFFFSAIKNVVAHEQIFAVMLGSQESASSALHDEIINTLSSQSLPVTLRIVDYDTKQKRIGRMTQFWSFVIANYVETDEKFFERFVKKDTSKKKTFSGAIARAASVQDELLLQQLLIATSQDACGGKNHVGVNVLLYGSDRLDKVGYITKFLETNNLEAWQAQVKEVGYSDVPSVVYIAQQYLNAIKNENFPGILVIQKADQALSKRFNHPSWFSDMMSDDHDFERKVGEMDSDELLLINNPIPAVWLVSSPSQIIPENVGRFLFQFELKGGSRADRRKGIETVIRDSKFSPELIPVLAKYYELNTEQIKSAAKMVEIMGIPPGPAADQRLIHLIENSQRALDREKIEELRDPITKYSLEYLNISGNMPVDKIIQSLKKRPIATLCFHGLPGTGKTQLAEYIAVQLDKQLIIKPASELLSKYLGESEQNIAKAFAEAQAEDAVFLLDEADSFLRDRSEAVRSWEVTQVNELLQRMERYKGTFICATNLFKQIDAAALRRFTFKLEFLSLTPQQALQMVINETGINFKALSKGEQNDIEMAVLGIKNLTPGDFATVKRQMTLLDEKLTVKEFLVRLDNEAKAKMHGIERNGYTLTPREAIEPVVAQVKQKV